MSILIKENISLKKLNTFGIDAKTKFYAELNKDTEALEILHDSKYSSLPKFPLGGGSNVLFTHDYEGIILRLISKGINIIEDDSETALVEAESGEIWDDLVTYCVNNSLYGVENLTLIPGTVGAAPIQNIGAYGTELKDVFDSLTGVSMVNGEEKSFSNEQCRFGYRDSIFKHELKNNFLITKVRLRLSKQKKFNLNYRAFQDYLKKEDHDKITLKEVNNLVKRIRQSKLPDPMKIGNAGSFFKNPEIGKKKFAELKKRFSDLVFFKVENDNYKIPAGWLIEKCGFKGKKIGNVGTYKNQALVIVNFGDAKGEEVQNFAFKIQHAVFEKFGIEIIPEVNIL